MGINKITPLLCYGVVGLSVVSAILGLFAKRLGGIEAIATSQLCTIALIWIHNYFLDPFRQTVNLQYLFGYHPKLFSTTSSANSTALLLRRLLVRHNPHQTLSSPYLSSYNISNSLADNFNILLVLQLLPFLAYVCILIIMKCFKRQLCVLEEKIAEEESKNNMNKKKNRFVKQFELSELETEAKLISEKIGKVGTAK